MSKPKSKSEIQKMQDLINSIDDDPSEKTIHFSIYIKQKDHRLFKAKASQEGRTMTDIINDWIKSYISDD